METTSRSRLMVLLLVAAATIVAATCAPADEAADRNHFYLESIRPAMQHLESIAPQRTDMAGIVVPTMDTYDLSMGGNLISLRRNFTRSAEDNAAAGPLHVAFREALVTEAGFAFGQTALNYSSTTTNVRDLIGLSLSSTRVDVMGLRQGFGSGEGASTMALTRTTTTQGLPAGDVATTVDALDFHSGLTKTTDLAVKGSHTTTDAKGGLEGIMLSGVLKLTFSGGETPFSYFQNHQFNAAQDILTEKMDFAIPMEAYKGKAIGEYHSDFTTTNGVEVGQRTTHFAMPWRMGDQTWSLDHVIFDQNQGKGMVETATTHLVSPFRIGKSTIATEGTRTVVQQGNVDTETVLAKLTAPLLGGNATVQHQTIKTETPSSSSEVEQLALMLPVIKRGRIASLTGSHVTSDTIGVADQDLTNVNLTADPLKPLHIEAQYQVDDRGPSQTLTSRQVQTKWAVCDKTTLTGRFSEAEVAGSDTPNTLRLIELVRERTGAGLGLRAGIASYGAPGADIEAARRFELTLGKPQTLAVNAAYSEYDPGSFARLPDQGTVAVSLEHGTPDTFSLRCRYEDQPARGDPLRAVELATKALGATLQFRYVTNPMAPDGKTVLQTDQYGAILGTKAFGTTVQLSYAANPLAPDGKSVRQADQYEATVGRKVWGDLNLEVGYRYLDYTADGDIDQNLRIRLDGGKEDGPGKLAVSFLTGDFAPAGVGGAPPPSTALDLSYSRKWGALGRISLSVKHQTAATARLGDDTTEGRLEFNRQF